MAMKAGSDKPDISTMEGFKAALLKVPAPPVDVKVRTTRYRAEVEKLLVEIGAR